MLTRDVANLFDRRELLAAWSWRIIRARYQQSILGGFWAIIQPAATVAIFSIIFTRWIPVDTNGVPYVIFSYTAMVPWTLFATSLTDMAASLVDNMGLVTKIYFPREILPIAALFARLLDATVAASALLLLFIYFRQPVFFSGWLFLPLIVCIQLALMLGAGLIGAALNVFYRDIKHLVALGLQLWFYATPIIYPLSLVPERWRPLYFLNPMAGIIEGYRAVLLYEKLPGAYLASSALTALLLLLAGYWLFKRLEFQMADVV